MLQLLTFSLVALFVAEGAFVPSFGTSGVEHNRSRRTISCLYQQQGNDSDASKLRDAAQKLRQDAANLEAQLSRKPASETTVSSPITPVSYTSLADSVWTVTYRFSSDPLPDDDDDNESEKKPETPTPVVSTYSGKLTLKLRPDGYTDLIRHEPTGANALEFEKLWGWDKEESTNQDDKGNYYLLFSSTVHLPSNDATFPDESIRFYWQARVDQNKQQKTITLADGAVTVKKDIEPPGGFWGVFNAGGILAQFRQVGNFVAKATRDD